MELKHDIVRVILMCLEEKDNTEPYYSHYDLINIVSKKYPKYKYDEIEYAITKLLETPYLSLTEKPSYYPNGQLKMAKIISLSWDGHEFLDNIRDDTFWNAAKEKAKKVGKFSISAVASGAKALATAFMTDPNAFKNLIQGLDSMKKFLLP